MQCIVSFLQKQQVFRAGEDGAQAVSKECSRCSILFVGDDGLALPQKKIKNKKSRRNTYSRVEEKTACFVLTKIRAQSGLFYCRSLKTLLAKARNLQNRSRLLRGIFLSEVPISLSTSRRLIK